MALRRVKTGVRGVPGGATSTRSAKGARSSSFEGLKEFKCFIGVIVEFFMHLFLSLGKCRVLLLVGQMTFDQVELTHKVRYYSLKL